MTAPTNTDIVQPENPWHNAQGSDVQQYTPIDLWGASVEHTWYFPGQENVPEEYKQYVTFKTMNEGARSRFQKRTARPLHIEQGSEARMTVDQAGDRHALLEASITGWKMYRNQQEYQYSSRTLLEWLKFANPEHVDKLERAIREANPWMVAQMTSEAIRTEIERLEQLEVEAKRREEEDAGFGDK